MPDLQRVRQARTHEADATYYAALDLVSQIGEELKLGTRHYRNKAGVLLTTLDEVVRAILEDDLLLATARRPGSGRVGALDF